MSLVYLTDEQMLTKEQIHAVACIGGLAENVDYSESKAIMNYWAAMRRKCGWGGGWVPFEYPSAAQALAITKEV